MRAPWAVLVLGFAVSVPTADAENDSNESEDSEGSASEGSATHHGPGSLLNASTARCRSAEYPLSSKCVGCPPMYKGKLCASTTWYEDRTLGSCGCGTPGDNWVDDDYWTLTGWTAALNNVNLDPEHPEAGWCPSGCGRCYELCTTGGTTNTDSRIAEPGQCKVFKITNRCSDGWGQPRPDWCSQNIPWHECAEHPEKCRQDRGTNMFGYSAHFDLQDAHRQIQVDLGWDNPEVTFEPVSCETWEGPQDAVCTACPS